MVHTTPKPRFLPVSKISFNICLGAPYGSEDRKSYVKLGPLSCAIFKIFTPASLKMHLCNEDSMWYTKGGFELHSVHATRLCCYRNGGSSNG